MTEQFAEHPDQVRRLFDAKAAAWPSKYMPDGRLVGRLTQLADAVTRHVPAGGSVLDLGCGTGELARGTANAGLRVTACDISPEMLHRAEASDPCGIVNWVGLNPGWRTLPFESHAFDAVVAASVFEYMVDPSTVLAECARMLRPGGVVLCTVPNLTHPIRWLEWLLSLSTHMPLTAALAHRWPQLQNYLTYLRLSRQRHFAKWWHATAARSGLHVITKTEGTSDHSPLRIFSFQLINDAEGY